MSTEQAMKDLAPVGELYTRVYTDRSKIHSDSKTFRHRLHAYSESFSRQDFDITRFVKLNSGIVIPIRYGTDGGYVAWDDFFLESPITELLDVITLIWRFYKTGTNNLRAAEYWQLFVAKALREEGMGYTLDNEAGVHLAVDEEFARNRLSSLRVLEAPRYNAVRTAYEHAYDCLDVQPMDSKGAVKSAFEALEILVKLIDPEIKSLGKASIQGRIKPLAVKRATSKSEEEAVGKIFESIGQFADAIHSYRHGQGTEDPILPSVTLTIYTLSTAASAIRWLVELDEGPSTP